MGLCVCVASELGMGDGIAIAVAGIAFAQAAMEGELRESAAAVCKGLVICSTDGGIVGDVIASAHAVASLVGSGDMTGESCVEGKVESDSFVELEESVGDNFEACKEWFVKKERKGIAVGQVDVGSVFLTIASLGADYDDDADSAQCKRQRVV